MRTIRALIATTVLLVGVAVVQQVYILTRPEPRQVLNYPAQKVLSRIDGVAMIRLGDELQVQGTKCNTLGEPVTVHGTTSWVSVDPPGSSIDVGSGVAVRQPGCVVKTYTNPLPQAVVTRTNELTAYLHTRCVTWQITGREVPTDPQFLPQTWESTPFDVCQPG